MGIDAQGLRFLLTANADGVSFAHSLMIGRQVFSDLSRNETRKILTSFNHRLENEVLQSVDRGTPVYIEPLLESFGAQQVDTIDFSPYEGATILHDMNLPIPDQLKNRFSMVIDGGALEHVFNYPQALKNAMEMVAVDGHLLVITNGNNFMGHGFYQFSPELFFRALSDANGFELQHMFACEARVKGRWYRVSDPEIVGQRVELVNKRPTYLLIQARRKFVTDVFAAAPQQSDYVVAWSGQDRAYSAGLVDGLKSLARRSLPTAIRRRISGIMFERRAHFKNTKVFRPFSPRS